MSGTESLDFSGIFKVETLVHIDLVSSCVYELGSQKLIAVAGESSLEYLYINSSADRIHKTQDWNFEQHPIICMCFEPSATWLLVISNNSISVIPFMPVFEQKSNYDLKWPLNEPTIIPINLDTPVSVAWWLTRCADNIAIIALKSGVIMFYSLDLQTVVRETRVPHEITDIQICFDDCLDLIVLLISCVNNQHWKLILEHRCIEYIWTKDNTRPTTDVREKIVGLVAYLTDQISTLRSPPATQDKPLSPTEYCKDPVVYYPTFRRGPTTWTLNTQYVNGRHFITAFDYTSGVIMLESPEEEKPFHTLHTQLKDERYRQALWSSRLVYLLTDSAVEVHSTPFADTDPRKPSREDTCLWRAELPCEILRGHLITPRSTSRRQTSWQLPTFLCDLQLPRFDLEPCVVVSRKGIYLLSTMSEPCEWLVGMMMRGGRGVERSAAALGCPLDTLLRAAADMLLSRSKIAPAKYLFLLSKSSPEAWQVRLGVFGLIDELVSYRADPATTDEAAVTVKLLAQILVIATRPDHSSTVDIDAPLSLSQLRELCSVACSLGLWEVLRRLSLHRGEPQLWLATLAGRRRLCPASARCMARDRCAAVYLLDRDCGLLCHKLVAQCAEWDTALLKRICIWLSPLGEQFRPVMRDLRDGRDDNIYTQRMKQLIQTFVRLCCELDARRECRGVWAARGAEAAGAGGGRGERLVAARAVSCGLRHFAICEGGDAATLLVHTPLKPQLIGRVLNVACGRHHTIFLTENGVYASGDNRHGQLGVGEAWAGPAGEAARAGGAPLSVRGPGRAAAVAAGLYHSAAVDTDGRLYTWGWGIHGQLGLGDTYDALVPKQVKLLAQYKVLKVACGACHTAALTSGGLFVFGSSMFGQLGAGAQGKSSVPVRLDIPQVVDIAVGHFHNLALTSTGELLTWGASPQAVRAAVPLAARRAPPAGEPPRATHLAPAPLDLAAVRGRVVQMSAGWHHSCLLTHLGEVYTWGLNFDGQLGTGDRKRVTQPQRVEIPLEHSVDNFTTESPPRASDNSEYSTKALIGCGGDFTIYVSDYGKIFIAGNMHEANEISKSDGRMIMMKNTRRIIKLPTTKTNTKFLFQYMDRFDGLLEKMPHDREMVQLHPNPLEKMSDFDDKWIDDILYDLKEWINMEDVADYPNVAAKLAFYKKSYSECLKYQLDNLTFKKEMNKEENVHKPNKANVAIVIKNRIKEIGLAYLNDKPFPELTADIYSGFPCGCDDLPQKDNEIAYTDKDMSKEYLAVEAANILDDALTNFPTDYEGRDSYLSLTKQFFLNNSLPGNELERVLSKYMGDGNLVKSAVMFSDESCEKLFTPKFYLTICSDLLKTSG